MNTVRNILSSRLSVAQNSWAMVDTDVAKIWIGANVFGIIFYDDVNVVKQGRIMKKFELAHMTPLSKMTISDTAQVQVSENQIFQLFPSKSGQATNTLISSGKTSPPIDKFNLPYLHEEPCR